MRLHRILAVSGFLCAAARLGAQQSPPTVGPTPPALAPGTPASSYALSGLDDINYFNGNLVVKIPVTSVGARGTAARTISVPIQQPWTVIAPIGELAPQSYTYSMGVQDLEYNPGYIQYGTASPV